MRQFSCREAGFLCNASLTAESAEELFDHVAAHLRDAHGVDLSHSESMARYARSLMTSEPEPRTGIELPPRPMGAIPAITLAAGLVYVTLGALGFIATGFTHWIANTDQSFVGVAVNPFENLLHVVIGVVLIAASMAPQVEITEGVLVGGGLALILLAFLGFTGNAKVLLSIDRASDWANLLHAVSGVVALVAGSARAVAPAQS